MLKDFLLKNEIPFAENESMKNHTTFKVGGKADFIAMPQSVNQAQKLIIYAKEQGIPFYFLGRGSNVIFKDEGYRGLIIKTSGLQQVKICENRATVQSGVLMTQFSKLLQENGLSGLEFCYGIPGNIGGGIFMNAGAYGGEISAPLIEVEYLDENAVLRKISKDRADFSYRHSIFQDNKWFITSATFELVLKDKKEMLTFMEEIMQKRRDKQPVDKPSAGSSFKRPSGYFAAALIDECGLKGMSVGGAQISEKHAGFIINKGGASCGDILQLAQEVEEIVRNKKGVQLEKEMIIVG
ncbi:MAG: UDP-N-acetylmuramate dehydrogenase [Oscillospiraceae bacterium]